MRHPSPIVLVTAIALLAALPSAWPMAEPAAAQDGLDCIAEVEPNDQLADPIPSLAGDVCLSGTLPADREQDLVLWEVAPEDGLTRWTFTVRGVPTTVTSVRVFPILATAGPVPTKEDIVSSLIRVDSDAHPDTPPGVATFQFPPGRYLLGISRGWPSFGQKITDDVSYEVSIVGDRTLPSTGDFEPNDSPSAATAMSGAFEVSGDLLGSEDHYRWTVSPDDVDVPWRLEARTAMGARLALTVSSGCRWRRPCHGGRWSRRHRHAPRPGPGAWRLPDPPLAGSAVHATLRPGRRPGDRAGRRSRAERYGRAGGPRRPWDAGGDRPADVQRGHRPARAWTSMRPSTATSSTST